MGLNKCVIFLIFLFGFLYFTQAYRFSPRIVNKPTDDIILNAGDNYTLTCEGTEPLKWIHPELDLNNKDNIEKINWTSFVPGKEIIRASDPYMYELTLYISNISYPFVGFYSCLHENGNEYEKDDIYLYVNDTEHLSVEDKYKVVYAVQYQEAIIPCRPTTPDIQVNLTSSTGDPMNTIYNPKIGFSFDVTHISFDGPYFCSFYDPNKNQEHELTIILHVTSPRDVLPTPFIEDLSYNHTDVGQDLKLMCVLQEIRASVSFNWKTPNRGLIKRPEVKKIPLNGEFYLTSTYVLKNATLKDSGIYTCIVSDRQTHQEKYEVYIAIHDKQTCFINIWEENNNPTISIEEGTHAQWIVEVSAHPTPELKWFDNRGKLIKNDTQYYINKQGVNIFQFQIRNATLENNGIYKIRGQSYRNYSTKSCPAEAELNLNLHVERAPSINLETQKVYLQNSSVEFKCIAKGNPIPIISWEFEQCTDDSENCMLRKVNVTTEKKTTRHFEVTSILTTTVNYTGEVACNASNSLGSSGLKTQYFISDIEDGFLVYNFGEEAIINKKGRRVEVIVAKDNSLTFTCAVSPHRSHTTEIFYQNKLINTFARFSIDTVTDKMSRKSTVSLRRANLTDGGEYSCRILITSNKYEYRNVTFIVADPKRPKIEATNLKDIVQIDYPKMPSKLYCNYTGIPRVSVEWYKDGHIIKPTKRIIISPDGSILQFDHTEIGDEGQYRCNIWNSIGEDSKTAMLKFKVKPVSVVIYYIITGLVLLLLLIALIYIIIKRRKEKDLERELKKLGLENFHKGNPENLNPDLGIDDQAELLPYDNKWEFPRDKLKLGKQLGSGAFGVVMKAEARGIIEGSDTTTVAVKMVKKTADQSYIKALASELKIMVHLGQHINVVNLLGACTKNVAKRELLVIVEFCRFGNIQNYLFKHRESFINQVDPNSGKIDYSIGSDVLERLYSVSSDNGSTITTPLSMQDYRERKDSSPVTSSVTQVTSLGDENITMNSNNSVQPEWRTNYKGDYKGNVKPVSTRDLITWSFQISRGMEYLAARKVLHGDLAARNILLADDNIVKICDFGLAKTMYKDNNYKKKGNSPLPIKWMAIESIRDRVFSTQSDVWSFGIVLYELFSLAKTPYAGMEADERLYYKLVEGYRMESPIYAPREIYTMMLDCWNAKPLARPSFTALVGRIGLLLEDSVRKHYVDLNSHYLAMNTQPPDGTDYLAMVSSPSFDVLSSPSPRYVNDVLPRNQDSGESRSPEGYTFMGAHTIFSPRAQDDQVFNFYDVKKKAENLGKESYELSPMLHSNNESDSESGYLRPISPINSISNPNYLFPMPIKPQDKEYNEKELFKSPDNYISMLQCKNIPNSNNKNSDSSEVKVDADSNKGNHYVNNDALLWDSVDV